MSWNSCVSVRDSNLFWIPTTVVSVHICIENWSVFSDVSTYSLLSPVADFKNQGSQIVNVSTRDRRMPTFLHGSATFHVFSYFCAIACSMDFRCVCEKFQRILETHNGCISTNLYWKLICIFRCSHLQSYFASSGLQKPDIADCQNFSMVYRLSR